MEDFQNSVIKIPRGLNFVYPKSRQQGLYIREMQKNQVVFGIGPAGTGKTFLAIAQALYLLLSKKCRKLVLTRPVVEAGESLGMPSSQILKSMLFMAKMADETVQPVMVLMRGNDEVNETKLKNALDCLEITLATEEETEQ